VSFCSRQYIICALPTYYIYIKYPSSPYLNRFLQPDTVIPDQSNPQSWNRFSYVLNQPINFNDPTGHVCEDPEKGEDARCFGSGTTRVGDRMVRGNNAELGKAKNLKKKDDSRAKDPVQTAELVPTAIPTIPMDVANSIGEPLEPGKYLTGYNGGGGGPASYSLNSVGGDGDCQGSVCTFGGGSVPLNYGANYDIQLYENLLIVTIKENYWIPGRAIPLMDSKTFGGSVLISTLRNGQQAATGLGDFSAGDIATKNLTQRDTDIRYWGRENFPVQLIIRINFGSQSTGESIVYYQLPYKLP
jgi:hypothetical protein